VPAVPTKPRAFPQDWEDRLCGMHESDVEQLLPIVGPVLGALMIVFGLRDYLIDPEHAYQAFLIRVAAVTLSAIAFRRTNLRWSPTQRAGYIYWVYASSLIYVACLLKDGTHYGMVTIAASVFLVALASLRISTFLWIASGPFLLYAALAVRDTSSIAYLNDIVSYVFNASLALVLMLMFRFFRQRAFLLELQLTHVAQHDSLTGLYNRGHITEVALREIMRARRHQRPFAVAMLDIDHFKLINDTYGHDIGDLALKAFADTCRACVREIDQLGRIGGEEFVCLLPETAESEALACAERLRECVAALEIDTPKGKVHFTVSIGVAVLQPEGGNWEGLLRDADGALYQAKCEGRNRVVLAQSHAPAHGSSPQAADALPQERIEEFPSPL
jgi:diguanylate cyclase (GGDEF)-like protein